MSNIRDGDLFKVITLHGITFEIFYGYYEDFERKRGEPVPIYPDFKRSPVYTNDGYPFVTQMQELCNHGTSSFEEGCCVDCEFYEQGKELIGICKNAKNKKAAQEKSNGKKND